MRKTGLALIALAGLIAIVRLRAGEQAPGDVKPMVEVSASSLAAPTKIADVPVKPIAKVEAAKPAVFARGADLERYHELAAKIFVTDEEKAARERLLHDADLLLEAGQRLVNRGPTTKALSREQDEALALLLAAARAHEPAAARALAAVVQNGAVEDVKLELTTRKQLAGLKAEAMYSWSSASPEAAEGMKALLPGPVSRKIWANVLERQHSNLAESAAGRVATGEDQ